MPEDRYGPGKIGIDPIYRILTLPGQKPRPNVIGWRVVFFAAADGQVIVRSLSDHQTLEEAKTSCAHFERGMAQRRA